MLADAEDWSVYVIKQMYEECILYGGPGMRV